LLYTACVGQPSLTKRQLHDVLVIGSQLGGLVAAALLAKRGHRVRVIDHDGQRDGYPDQGYTLPYAPALLPPLKGLPAAEAAFGELGMLTDLGRALTPHEPALQILAPGHRFDLPHDAALRARELAREFADPKGAEAAWAALQAAPELADAFFKDAAPFPALGFFEQWRSRRRAQADASLQQALTMPPPEGHPIAAVARGLAGFVTHLDAGASSGLALSRALGLWLRGPQREVPGHLGVRGLLHKRIRELGSEVQGLDRPAVVDELQIRGSRVTGVKLQGDDGLHVGRAVISGTDAQALRRLVPPQARKKHLAEQLDAVRLQRFLLAVNLVVPARDLPQGLAALGVLIPRDEALGLLVYEVLPAVRGAPAPPASGSARPISAKTGRADAGTANPDDERVICVAALVRAPTRDLGDEPLEQLAAQVRAAMLEVLPFVRPKVVSVPLLTKGANRGSRLSPHPLFEIDEPAVLGVTGLSLRTPLHNLFLASREVLPGLGVEGELLTGLRVAERVQRVLHKKDPLAAA